MGMTPDTKRKLGYTLIELVIVIAVFSLIMPVLFGTLYIIMQQQLRIYRLTEVKRQGDYTLNFLKESIARDVVQIYDASVGLRCSTTNSSFIASTAPVLFKKTATSYFSIQQHTVGPGVQTLLYIEYSRDPVTGTFTQLLSSSLTSNVVSVRNFAFRCYRRSSSSFPLVGLLFDLQYNDSTPTPEEGTVSLRYQTFVKLRRTDD